MRSIFLLSAFLMLSSIAGAQAVNPDYDSVLAKKLGADERGMKMYVLVILKTGSNTTANKATADSLFAGHFSNMERLVKLKKLIVAGPLEKNDKTYRGIFILDVPTLSEARELVATDPTIKAKVLEPELYEWYGSAALPQYLKDAEKIRKHKP